MAEWKVSRQQVKLTEHPDAEKLEIANLGGFQLVVQKGLHQDGNVVVFIPEKSLLPNEDWVEGFRPYLVGPNKDRVKSIKLRGEISMGIIIPDEDKFSQFAIGEDISDHLHVVKYEPPIPQQLAGEVASLGSLSALDHEISKHDVEQFAIHKEEFVEGEPVIVTEKIHGSQCCIIRTKQGERAISSKGLLSKGLILKESDRNSYWRAAVATGIFDLIDKHYPDGHIQVFGELVPCQKGFNYGFSEPTILLFEIRNGYESVKLSEIHDDFRKMWVPVLYEGPLDIDKLRELRKGNETASDNNRHIREGIVVRPAVDRSSSEKFRLMLKLLNPAYKETGDEFN
tara:strand:- start:1887 stop:2909 length:1023 start_codon:yes stop_codon:yes gene_type:complete